MKKALLLLLASPCLAGAAVIQFDLFNPNGVGETLRISDGSNPLSGTLVELGFFSVDTPSFSGTWTPLDSNSMGTGGDAGYINQQFTVDTDTAPAGLSVTTVLAFRFYDSVDNSGGFNTVTDTVNPDWVYAINNAAPPIGPPPRSLALATGVDTPSAGLAWENGAGSAFSTIPEPSSILLSALGLGLVAGRRKRA